MDALTRRINEMIVEMPDNLTLEEKTDIARNNLKIEKALGVTKGKPMTYEQANKGKENPKFGKEEGYLSLIHISEPTRLGMISYAVFCLKKKTRLGMISYSVFCLKKKNKKTRAWHVRERQLQQNRTRIS